jgi:hypothetical protein
MDWSVEQAPEPPLLNSRNLKKKEHIPRLTTAITTVGCVYPVVQGRKLLSEATAVEQERELRFLNKGAFSVLRSREEILDTSRALALFQFSREQNYIADMFTGLYTLLTRGEKFIDIEHIYARDPLSGRENLTAIRIITNRETLYKAALGPLLNNNARSLSGAYDIVHDAKKVIDPIIYGKVPMPRATVTLKNMDKGDGTRGDVWISGEPMHIYRAAGGLFDLVAVDLDCFFAPVKITGDKIRAGDQFISHVAGMTAMLQLGKRYTDEGTSTGINSQTAKRIILATQMGVEIGRITGLGVKTNASGRKNIVVRREELPNIIPEAIQDLGRPRERPNFKKVSEMVAKAGQYLYKAIEKTDILEELKAQKSPIYIPATDRGAEFPNEELYQHIVYFKADRINH